MRAIYLSLVCTALLFQPLWAQQTCRVDTIFEFQYIPGTSIKDSTHQIINTYNSSNQLIKRLELVWDPGSNSFRKDGRADYTYNAQGLISEVSFFEYASASVYLTSKELKTYNSANLLEEDVLQIAPTQGATLRNFNKKSFNYDGAGNLTERLIRNWSTSSNNWELQRKTEYTYISSNLMSKEELYFWRNNSWEKFVIRDNTYNSQNQLSAQLIRTLNQTSNLFQNQTKINCQYNMNGNLSDSLIKEYDFASSSWEDSERFSLGYNANNDLVAVLKEVYLLGAWQERNRTINSYDSKNNLTRSLKQVKAAPISTTWRNSAQDEYEYDQNNCLTAHEEYKDWNISAGYFNIRTRKQYTHSAFSNVGLAQHEPSGLSVFPNPAKASETFTLICPQEGPYVIYNRLGQVVKEGQLKKGENRLASFSEQARLYLLKTQNSTLRLVIEK